VTAWTGIASRPATSRYARLVPRRATRWPRPGRLLDDRGV